MNNIYIYIENKHAFVLTLEKHCNQINTKICFFLNPSHKNKILLFSISVKMWFRFLYKTMTKQIVYLNNITRKSGFRLQFLRQPAFKLTNDAPPLPLCQRKVALAYFEAISLLPKHVGERKVFINGRCIGYILAENSWTNGIRPVAFYWANVYLSLNFKVTVIA